MKSVIVVVYDNDHDEFDDSTPLLRYNNMRCKATLSGGYHTDTLWNSRAIYVSLLLSVQLKSMGGTLRPSMLDPSYASTTSL